jgi:hypothetical protein
LSRCINSKIGIIAKLWEISLVWKMSGWAQLGWKLNAQKIMAPIKSERNISLVTLWHTFMTPLLFLGRLIESRNFREGWWYTRPFLPTVGFTIFPYFVAPRPPPANHKPQTREPWPYLADFADFDTTIPNSFLGQISYLRWGNPLGASAPATQWTSFASAAWGCSFLLGAFLTSVKLADFVSGSQRWALGPPHDESSPS